MASELIPPAYEERTRYRQIEAELKAIYDTEFKNSNTPERDLHLYDECITLAGQLPEVDQKRHAGTLAKPMQIHGLTRQDILKDIQSKAELKKNPKQKQLSVEDKATALYELVLPGVKLARDIATGETYVSVLTVGVDRPSPWTSTHSKAFQSYLNDAAYGEFRWIVRPEILRTVILKLDGDKAEAVSLSRLVAQYRGPRDKPDRKDAICYDLANEKGEAVKVSPGTWDVVTLDTPLFKRPGITLPPQITPRGDIDDIKRLSELLSIPDTKDEVLSLAWIVSAFVPSLNRPIMNLCGTYARRR
ncbi:MAG: hypothetical protein ACXVIP_04330, partial [Halobacteriota archaeon]